MKITKYESPLSPIEAALDRVGWGFPLIDRFVTEGNGDREWSAVRLPKTNVHETDQAYVFTIEMPGLTRDNVEVNFEGNSLVVKGEKSESKEEKGIIRKEYYSTRFERTFNIGTGVDREKVKAKMEDGLLTVTLPKTQERLGRKIEVA